MYITANLTILNLHNVAEGLSKTCTSCKDVSDSQLVDCLRNRVVRTIDSVANPVLYRSKLFPSISLATPALLVDILATKGSLASGLEEKSVFVTIYDLTYRFDYDSRTWVERLLILSRRLGTKEEIQPTHDHPESSLSRVFFTAADCNIDYSSSPRFHTAGRIICRVGDIRLSSNVLSPPTANQALSISVGDLAIYLCNSRHPYTFENSRLVGAAGLIAHHDTAPTSNVEPAEVEQRRLNYRSLVSLDSVDAIVVHSIAEDNTNVPAMRVSLNVGEAGVFVCKDSFARFVSIISDLSTQLCAVDESGFAKLKADGIARVKHDRKSHRLAPRPSPQATSNDQAQQQFLLDGYDWTTVDQTDSSSNSFQPDDDQCAGWYDPSKSGASSIDKDDDITVGISAGTDERLTSNGRKLSPQIIHNHLPVSAEPIDPIGEGDLGALKYVDPGIVPVVGLRVLLHDFDVKIKCFDGYDWPELIPSYLDFSPEDGPFVIRSREGVECDETKNDAQSDIKSKLLKDLLEGTQSQGTFQDVPLPEDKKRAQAQQALLSRLSRRTNRYFLISVTGIRLRLDSMSESIEHDLVWCMFMQLQDFFAAETISSERPIKMVGEWVNENEHPRVSSDGMIAIKVSTDLAAGFPSF